MADALDSGSSVRKDFRVQVPGSASSGKGFNSLPFCFLNFIEFFADPPLSTVFCFHPMLTSLQNPLVKQLRKLQRAKERQQQGLFLLEGTHLLEEADSVDYPLVAVCFTSAWREKYPLLWERLQAKADRCEEVSEEVLQAIATTQQPDGVVATAPRRPLQAASSEISGLIFVLEAIQDPGNLGTMIRAAAAAGVEALWLSQDTVDLDNPKVLRASAGQWFRLPMVVTPDLIGDVQRAKQQGIPILATLPQASESYWEVDLRRPSLILLGNEGAGLSQPLADLADVAVKIPLAPGVESLNVAIAASLIAYEALRQKR